MREIPTRMEFLQENPRCIEMFGRGGRLHPRRASARKLGEGIAQGRHLRIESLEARRLLSLTPFISEVEAANSAGIADAAGTTADWLEICNPDATTPVNLAGWSLTYQKTGSNSITTWTIPSTDNVVLGPNESRVFFCDSNSATDPVQELHTSFNLSKSGATVELLNASKSLISTLTYPALTSDVSYGVGEAVTETDLVAAGATASYYAPTNNSLGTTWTQPGFDASSWAAGPTGLGTSLDYAQVSGFATTLYQANTGVVSSLAQAETVISTPSEQTSATSKTEGVLDFLDTGSGGHFTGEEQAFPGLKIDDGGQYYVLQATGTLTITRARPDTTPSASTATTGLRSRSRAPTSPALTNATNASGSNTMAYNGLRERGIRWGRRTSPPAATRSTWSISRTRVGRAWSSMPLRRAVPRPFPASRRVARQPR